MKILIVINALVQGGAENQSVQDANELLRRGHQVTFAFEKNGKGATEDGLEIMKDFWKTRGIDPAALQPRILLRSSR